MGVFLAVTVTVGERLYPVTVTAFPMTKVATGLKANPLKQL